jgi:PAS domain S-box-containing protein
MGSTILIVDDEESIRFTFSSFLKDEGYDVEVASSIDECRAALSAQDFDLIYLDILLGVDSGIEALRLCKEQNPVCPVVMVTGSPNLDTATEAVRLGAFDYIPKPVRQETLLRITQKALQHKQLVDQKEAYRARLNAIFQSVKEGIITVDRDMRISGMNDAARNLFGYDGDEMGVELQTLFPANQAFLDLVQNSFETEQATDIFRIEMTLKKNRTQVISLTTSALIEESGRSIGAVITLRDETRLDFLERDLKERSKFDRLIGVSAAMQEVYSLVESLADVDTTVLVTGESGTGKELIAESLHYRSPRRDKPLVRVNCAALPETLLESELFGHVKGSFTGAMQDKMGRFQRADGGTILLDEIADISPALQVRLLRVLQEWEIERVGGNEPIPVDIRVIAATNKNLREKVLSGEFREDLYYRLKVVEVKLPPLRDRREDIPMLIEHFIDKFNKRFQRQIAGASRSVLDALLRYDWPGNVRELEHVIEHAFVLCRDSVLAVEHLPEELKTSSEPKPTRLKGGDCTDQDIIAALQSVNGNKSKAAELLGMSRRTIYRKMEEFGLLPEKSEDS